MTTSSQITSSFQRILFRDPTAAELNTWVSAVDAGAVDLSEVRASLIALTETSNFVDPVIRLYQAAFGRVPESNEALDFYADRLRDGRMSITTMADAFAASPEFAVRYGASGPNSPFIFALYLNVLDRVPSGAEVDWYLASRMTASEMLLGFAQSPEFQQKSASAIDAFLNNNAQGTAVFTGPLQIPSSAPTFELTSNAQTVAEGGTVQFTLQTQNVAEGSTYSWAISGGVQAADVVGGQLSGTAVIDSQGRAIIPVALTADARTEGAENLVLSVAGRTATVTVNDTSVAPVPSYSLSASTDPLAVEVVNSVNEGQALYFTISTENVAAGTSLAYVITGVSSADISGAPLSGTVTIDSSGLAVIAVTLSADAATEGRETLQMAVSTPDGAIFSSITVNDTSVTAAPTYSITPSGTAIDEGGVITYTIATTGVPDGAVLQYVIDGVQAADVSRGSLSGTTVVSNGTATVSLTLALDNRTEGAETLAFTLRREGVTVASAATVVVNDTSVGNFTVTAATITAANAASQQVAVVTRASADPIVNVSILSDVNTATNGFIIQGDGNHSITGGGLNDRITVNGSGNNTVLGALGNDTLSGGTGNDSLVGGAGNDLLVGGDGNDMFVGGAGEDTMLGGAGNDIFIVGNGEFVDLEQIQGGDGTDTLLLSGTNNLTQGTLAGVEVLSINSTVTLLGTQLADVTTLSGNGSSQVIIQGGTVDLRTKTVTDLASLALSNGATVRLDAATLAEIGQVANPAGTTLIIDAAGYTALVAKGATNARVQVEDSVANILANLASLSGATSVTAGAVSVVQAVQLVEAGLAGTVRYSLSDTPANLVLAANAVLTNATGMVATASATAIEAALLEAAGATMRTGVSTATFSYSVSDTAANLVTTLGGLNSAASVTVTTVANVAQATAIRAATGEGNAGAVIPGTGTSLSYSLQDSAANLAGAAASVRNGATNITATGTATVAEAIAIEAATNGGTTIYNVSGLYADLTAAPAAAAVNAAQNVTVTGGALNVLQANAIEAFSNRGTNSYALADTIQVLLAASNGVVASATTVTPSGAPYTLAQVSSLVTKYTGDKIANASLTATDTAANWAAITPAVAREINGPGSTLDGILNVGQAAALRSAFGEATPPTYSITDSAAAIAGATAAVRNGAANLTANTPASMAQAVIIEAATGTASYSISDAATAILTSAAGNAAATRNGATNINATGTATVADAQALLDITNSGTTTIAAVSGTAVATAGLLFGMSNNDTIGTVTVTDAATVAQATTLRGFVTAGDVLSVVHGVGIRDTVAAIDAALATAQGRALLDAAGHVELRDTWQNLNAAGADAARARADVVVATATLADLAGLVATANAFKAEVDQFVVADVLTVANKVQVADLSFFAPVSYSASGLAADLLHASNATFANGAVNLTVTDATINVATAAQIQALTNSGTVAYNLQDTAANLANASALIRSGDANALTSTGGTVTAAQALTLAGLDISGSYIVSDTAANLSGAAMAAALTDGSVTSVTVTDSGFVTTTVAGAIKIYGPTGNSAGNYNIADTAAALAGANPTLRGYAHDVTATTNATMGQATAIAGVQTMGTVSYSISDLAPAIAGASAAVRNGATNIVATGTATVAEATTIEAATNSGTTTIAALSGTAAQLAASSNAVLNLVTGTVTATDVATPAQAVTLAGFTKAVVYNVEGSASALVAVAGAALNEAVNVTATGTANVEQATAIEAATNSGTTSIAAISDTVAALAGSSNAVLDLVTGTVTATGTATAAQAATLAGFTEAVVYSVSDTVANIVTAAGAALNEAVNVTATGNATLAQAQIIEAATNTGTTTYRIADTYANLIANADMLDGADAAALIAGASQVTVTHPVTVAQATALVVLTGAVPLVYAIVDTDNNLAAAINADSALLTGATSVTTSAGVTLELETIGGQLTLVLTKAERDALPVGLRSADYIIEASVADVTGANAAYYAALPAANLRVIDTYANLTSGVPVVEAAGSVHVLDAITAAQSLVIDAFGATAANTSYALSDTAANIVTALGRVGISQALTDITATGTATTAQAATILAAANGGTTTIAAVSGSAAAVAILNLTAGESIGAVTVTGTATVVEATAIAARVTAGQFGAATYSISGDAVAVAGAGAAALNGAVNITATGTASATHAATILAATNSGATFIDLVQDSATNVARLAPGANDTIESIVAVGDATVAQANAIALLDAREGTTVSYQYFIRDTADAILGASLAVLDNTSSGMVVQGNVDVTTAGRLLAIDTADTTISIGDMRLADTAANLLAAPATLKANGNGVMAVTVQGATTVAQIGQISSQYLQTNVDIGGFGLTFNLTDSFANLSALGALGARNAAGTITLTNPSLTVAQANVAENWKATAGAVVYSVADAAWNVAAAISDSGVLNDELANATSITLTSTATVSQAAKLSEVAASKLPGGYTIADTVANVLIAFNSVNTVGGTDRGTIRQADSVTLINPATVVQYVGTGTVRGLDEVVNLAGYSLSDTAANLIAAIAANPAALDGADQLLLTTNEELSVAQATQLTSLVNFDGFQGGFRVFDSVDNILNAPAGLLAAATSFTVQDDFENLVELGGIAAIKLAYGVSDVNVRMEGVLVTQPELTAIDAVNGNGTITYNLTGTFAQVASNDTSLLNQAINLTTDPVNDAGVADLLKILDASNSGVTTIGAITTLNANGASQAQLSQLANYIAGDAGDQTYEIDSISAIMNLQLTGSLTPTQVNTLLALAAPGSASVIIATMDASYLPVLADNAVGIADGGISGALGHTNLTLSAEQFAALGPKFANGLTVTVDATGANDAQIAAMAANIDNIIGGGILNLNLEAAEHDVTNAVFAAVLAQATGAVVDATGATPAEVGAILNNLPRIADNGLTGLQLELADFNLLPSGTKALLNQKMSSVGSVTINGTNGNDTIDLSSSMFTKNYLINGFGGNDTIIGSSGNDTIIGGTGDDSLTGGLGNDVFVSTSGNDVITDLSTGDVLQASGVHTTVVANNVSAFVATSATSNAGAAVTINAAAGGGTINVAAATGTTGYVLNGNAGDDILTGSGFADTIIAGAGEDNIAGMDGNDTIRFLSVNFTSDDMVDGGDGDDTIEITDTASFSDGVFANKSGVETLLLSGTGALAHNVTLGTDANNAGIRTVTATASTGNSTINIAQMAGNVTVSSGSGNDTVVTGSGNNNISTGLGNDTIRFTAGHFTSADTVDGGGGTDTIEITDAGTVEDADFTNVDNVERLQLANGTNTVTLATNARDSGLVSVIGGTGADTINAAAYTVGINIAAGNGDNSVSGGSGADTITAGSGNDTVNAGGGDDNISTGFGNDTIRFTAGHFTSNDTVNGGDDTDTIEITDNSTGGDAVGDADFTRVTSVETLLLSGTGSQSVTLGVNARNAGIVDVIATAGNASTINFSAMTGDVRVVTGAGNDVITAGTGTNHFTTGEGDDTIRFLAQHFGSHDLVRGGEGTDTIEITDNASGAFAVSDSHFNNAADPALNYNAEVLLLSGTGALAHNVTLGSLANTAGIRTVTATASTGNSTINIAQMAGNVTVSSGSGNDTVVAGSGNNNISTGLGDDTIRFTTGHFTSADTVDGGGGTDTIEITDGGTVEDADFTNVDSVERLQLANGTNTVTLATNAQDSGLVSVIGGTGADTIDASAYTVGINIAADNGNNSVSGGSGADTITAGGGNDTVNAGGGDDNISTGFGNDTIRFTAGHFTSADTVNGGGNTDTIEITDNSTGGDAVGDADFTRVMSVERLLLSGTGAQTATLGSLADTAGIRTVTATASTDASTINIAQMGANVTVSSGSGNDTVVAGSGDNDISTGLGDDTIRFLSGHFTSADFVNGGGGTDTIEITDAASFSDGVFAHKSDVETLLLSGQGPLAHSVTLGTDANTAGIRTVTATASTGNSTINIAQMAGNVTVSSGSGNDLVVAGSGNNNISTGLGDDTIQFTAAAFTSADTVNGGEGTDTIEITDASTGGNAVGDVDFTNVTSVEELRLGAFTNTVTLGDLAALAGIATVVGGTVNDTLILTDDSLVAGSITGVRFESAGGNDVFNIGGLTVSGTLALLGNGADADTIIATDGANISALNAGGVTTAENLTLTGGITMTLAQHNAIAITANGSADQVTLTTAGTFTGQASVESYVLGAGVGNVFTQVAGNTSVTGGSGNDTIITAGADATRGALTINLTGGGQDTVHISNTSIGNNGVLGTQAGLGGRLVDWDGGDQDSNRTTLNDTIAFWTAAGSNDGINFVTITNFTTGDDGDKVKYLDGANSVIVGGFMENVDISSNNLLSLAPNSVIEISAVGQNGVQIADGTNLGAVATILSQLNNVQDGNYYVVIYDGAGINANAYLYAATATEGDFFDFADVDGGNNGFDTDTVELIGFFQGVGANSFTSLNFI